MTTSTKYSASSLTHAAHDSMTMLTRNLRHTLRSPDAMITTIAVPISILLLFVYVFGGAIHTGGAYIDYVVPGIIVMCAGFGSATTAVRLSTDMHNGIIDRFRVMAVARSAVLAGHVAESVLRNLITVGTVILLAVALGFRPTTEPVRWLATVGVIAGFTLAMSWLAAAFGLLAPTPEAANGATVVFIFLPQVSSAFVPTTSMPGWLRGFAAYQPFTPITETVRGLLTGTPIAANAFQAIGWCVGIALCGYPAARILLHNRTTD